MTDRPRILIVEDERIVARNLQRRLEGFGYVVAGITAYAEEAIDLAALETPNLVLMDIRLKGKLDGIDAAAQIRSLDIPVVYLTAHSDEETLRAAQATEPFGYVLKPFGERELQVVIEMALYKHGAERERRKLEEQARRAQNVAALGQLAGGIAHDFNNVLMVILNACAALIREAPEGLLTNRVTLIRTAAERAARMTSQLLSFGRQQASAGVAPDPERLIRDIVAMLSPLIGEDVTIETRIEPGLRAIGTMPWHIEQMILNLVVNARDAMPTGGSVIVSAENIAATPSTAARVLLTVADTGEGMDADTRARIFQPFFTTKPVGDGTGMGLATVFELVAKAGGTIEVVSALGRGTAFLIWLPTSEEVAAEPDAASTPPPLPLVARTVLLVEDDAQVRALLHDMLRTAGATVLEATDGIAALEVCRAHDLPIDIVLSDVVMPRMSGDELSRRLAIDRPTTKVMHMSGYPDISVPGGRTDGNVLVKPFTRVELLSWIRRALADPPVGL